MGSMPSGAVVSTMRSIVLSRSTRSLSRVLQSCRLFSSVPSLSLPQNHHKHVSKPMSNPLCLSGRNRNFVTSTSSTFSYSPQFQKEFSTLLEELSKGLLAMKDDNEIFELIYIPNESLTLNLANNVGSYQWIASPHSNQVMMFSPASGVHQYTYNHSSERWEDVHDHHILLELLVRELITSLRGLPAF